MEIVRCYKVRVARLAKTITATAAPLIGTSNANPFGMCCTVMVSGALNHEQILDRYVDWLRVGSRDCAYDKWAQ